jgi:hypothetical protein
MTKTIYNQEWISITTRSVSDNNADDMNVNTIEVRQSSNDDTGYDNVIIEERGIFSENPIILESKVKLCDAEKTHHDKYVIATNAHVENAELYGDIIAILTPEEYANLKKPNPMTPKYVVMEGLSLKVRGLGVLGYYM